MALNIDIDLNNPSSIDKAIQQIEDYKNDLPRKLEQIGIELAEVGIRMAQQHIGEEFAPYIVFEKAVDGGDVNSGMVVRMVGRNVEEMRVIWIASKKNQIVHGATVNAVLMNEVGSGFYVYNPQDIAGGEQGALNTYGHAFDQDGWFWYDINDGQKHHSKGDSGNLALLNAYNEMYHEVIRVARKVFADG